MCRVKRLWCLVRGHDPVKLIDDLRVRQIIWRAGTAEVYSEVLASHFECRRCYRSLAGDDA